MKIQKKIQANQVLLTIISGCLIVTAFGGKYLLQQQVLYESCLFIASVIGGLPIAIQAYQAAKVKVLSIDLLVTVAVLGALFIGEYNESAIVTFLFLFGHVLEQKTLAHTRSAIQSLINMSPAKAWKYIPSANEDAVEKTAEVAIEEVKVGDRLLVKAGAQVPVDGMIVEGSGYLKEAAVTGEAELVRKAVGAMVFAGTILENGTLKIQAQKVGEETTFGKIIELVEEAQDSKSAAERLIDRFATYYTPLILVLAVLIGLITKEIRLAITLLVLGCPGALIIGVPVANVAGIGNGAKNGVLIKGSEVMATFSRVDTIVFDKTGTLTEGKPSVTAAKIFTDKDDLALTAAVEAESDHPLGQAILQYARTVGESWEAVHVEQTKIHKGRGVQAVSNGHDVLIGNRQFMIEQGIELSMEVQRQEDELRGQGHSIVLVACDQQLTQLFGIKDAIRSGASETIHALRKSGIKRLIMLTGDHQHTANLIGHTLGLTEIHGELLPEEKADFIRHLQKKGEIVAFVGDGINDSPSIALADIGIAMGNGTDVAVETSDIVLIQSRIEQLNYAYQLTKRTVRKMKENILIALGTVLFLLVGLVFGFIYMASGMFFHELSILLVVLNAMRLLAKPNKSKLDTNQLLVTQEELK
ncbi:heavy metal translocating P-type ATPase [Enterococcus gallinarum]|uniref:heavy metal translocating P-type ATPase n=1 Tax=Enterococcus gallinarum TaxID=1353 RepID=UPI000F50B8B6|nr:heavy metal translocating P-type ATPase [Enterococcus gallinarum]ROY71463.1 heavy metal translocating P-type ATPase [Enterococcus gallinarum]ROZ03122.1 heavy metal translocating P-type ATPase [Enterococcus gallinarum]ROZ09544.1 heavy metal translocating P-type ATPase [Enterococcus gallinarum]ROZ33056.1 heavy metal translocating P-type ATPase [Enterococcus gallinarum]